MAKGMRWLCPATNKDCQRNCVGDMDRPRCVLERAQTERDRWFAGDDELLTYLRAGMVPASMRVLNLDNIDG